MVRGLAELILLGWFGWGGAATVLWLKQRRLNKGLDEPELWLSRRERRAVARKRLKREDDEYEEQLMERLTKHLNERTQLPHEK